MPAADRVSDVLRQHHDAEPLRARMRDPFSFGRDAMHESGPEHAVPVRANGRCAHLPHGGIPSRHMRRADRRVRVVAVVTDGRSVRREQHVRAAATARLPAGVDGVPARGPQRLHRQRTVHQRVRKVLHRDQGVPGGLQRHEHVLQDGLHRSDAIDVRELVAVERVHAGQRLHGGSACLHLAVRADSHPRVPRAVREHTADRSVDSRCNVPRLDLAADRFVSVAALVFVAESAKCHACVLRWRKRAGRHVDSWRDVSGVGLQRWVVLPVFVDRDVQRPIPGRRRERRRNPSRVQLERLE